MKNLSPITHVENLLAALGVGLSLTQIEEMLGIVLLSLQVAIIVFRVIFSLIKKVKGGDVEGAIKEIRQAETEIQRITEKKEGRKDGKENDK